MTIKEARESAGLTQKQVHDLFGVPVRSLQNWEAGIRICPQYVEDMLVEKMMNLSVRRFIIVYEDEEGNFHEDYIQALNPQKAIDILGIPKKQVRDVAVCIEDFYQEGD